MAKSRKKMGRRKYSSKRRFSKRKSKKGSKSKTHSGKNFMTRKGSKYYDRKGHFVKPYSKRKRSRKVKKLKRKFSRRRFGSKGPGYKGATSFQNGYVNYFGSQEPFVNASEWWYPDPGSKGGMIGSAKTNYQSPNMIYKY